MNTVWNDAEDEALQDLPITVQILYLRGLRRYMNYNTGIVGEQYGTSYNALARILSVAPKQGRHINATGIPTRDQIRWWVKTLIDAGLVERVGDGRYLILRLPLATVGPLHKAGTSPITFTKTTTETTVKQVEPITVVSNMSTTISPLSSHICPPLESHCETKAERQVVLSESHDNPTDEHHQYRIQETDSNITVVSSSSKSTTTPSAHAHARVCLDEITNTTSTSTDTQPIALAEDPTPPVLAEQPTTTNSQTANKAVTIVDPVIATNPVLSSIATSNAVDIRIKKQHNSVVQEIFDYWRQRMNAPNAILDKRQGACILARIKEGFTTEDLKLAIDGCKLIPFNMGENPKGLKFNGISTIFGSYTATDNFRNVGRKNKPRPIYRPEPVIPAVMTTPSVKPVADDPATKRGIPEDVFQELDKLTGGRLARNRAARLAQEGQGDTAKAAEARKQLAELRQLEEHARIEAAAASARARNVAAGGNGITTRGCI